MTDLQNRNVKKFSKLLFLVSVITGCLIFINIQKNETKNISNKKIESLIKSYAGFIKDGSDEKLSDSQFEDLKYRYFSKNATNISSKTVYRPRNVQVDSITMIGAVPFPSSETLKKTNFMEAFREDSQMGDSRLVFSRNKSHVIISSTFGEDDCYLFIKGIKLNRYKITINTKQINEITNDDLRSACKNDYNMITVQN